MTSDERAVANLVHGLAEAIDDGDLARVAALFGDATFTLEGREPRVGGAAFARTIEQSMLRYEGGRPSTLHQITNLVVDVDDATGTAASRCSITVYQSRPDFPLQPIMVGSYRDRFARGADGAWAWVERRMVIDLVGDTSRHSPNRF